MTDIHRLHEGKFKHFASTKILSQLLSRNTTRKNIKNVREDRRGRTRNNKL